MRTAFRVGFSRDFLAADGSIGFGEIGLDRLTSNPGIEVDFLAESPRELRPDHLEAYDAVVLLSPRVTARSLAGAERLALIARFGVGYDNIDIDACSERGVLVTTTPEATRTPMATTVLTLILALSHRLMEKDRLIRSGHWADKWDFMGHGLAGRTLGSIGLGTIGREILSLTRPLKMKHIAYDPYVPPTVASELGLDLVDLDTLIANSDYITINCALTPETFHLIDARRIGLMKPTAFLINSARGPIVDQGALTTALQEKRIAGAALDVFEAEPIDPNDPLLTLENVIVTPHALCWTDDWALATGGSVCDAILAVASGEVPQFVVNRVAIDSSLVQQKVARFARRRGA
ncbi:MAG: dehydrogenase [Chloroflexota bacterium]|nr:dehydrogenase [Chloroflexota bacterium]